MVTLSPAARALLESDALAHLVTLGSDGSPQVTCIWVGLDGDEIVSAICARISASCRTCARTHASRCRWRAQR